MIPCSAIFGSRKANLTGEKLMTPLPIQLSKGFGKKKID
jgi:hypothetical protein